ncbi:3'(2'),5'-bisphosphate nucleotidase CysQ [subsurface metagenome]
MKINNSESFIDLAQHMADVSGEILRRSFQKSNIFADKSDASPVTEIDLTVERAIRGMIQDAYPEHGIIGEEVGDFKRNAEYVWLIDPIDGTKAFIAGIPVFGTLIALARNGEPFLGIIDQPILRQRWVGVDGAQTMLNGSPVHVRKCQDISEAIIDISSPEYFKGDDRNAFNRLRKAVKWAVYGGSCYAYGMLAAGFLDIGLEVEHEPPDYCALVPIVRNAGGVITDWQGDALTINSGNRFIAAGDHEVHARAISLLNSRR